MTTKMVKKNRHTSELSKLEKARIAGVVRTNLTLVLQALHDAYSVCPMCFAGIVIDTMEDFKKSMQKARKKRGAGDCLTWQQNGA